MSAWIDRLLNGCKWLFGLLSVALFPGLVMAWVVRLPWLLDSRASVGFVVGAVLYGLLWRLIFSRRALGSALSTLEHELTHAVFAWLTLHAVTGLRVTWRDGGRATIRGQGNWLIFLAPYFFPTISVVVAVALLWAPPELLWPSVVLGVVTMYHVISSWRNTHSGQTDLAEAGYVFSWVFLPGANLLSYGMVLAFTLGGGAEVMEFVSESIVRSFGIWESLVVPRS